MIARRCAALLLLGALWAGCRGESKAPVFEVVARGLQFEAPKEVPSGWITIRFTNQSDLTHFAVVEQLPPGVGIAEQQAQVAPVFQAGMDLLNAGKTDSALARFGALPAWFQKVVFRGGPGLTGPGKTSETTLYLEPGTYLLECYVKTGGTFHSFNPAPGAYGMVHQFTVTGEGSPAPQPSPDIQVVLSSSRGLVPSGEPQAGPQIVAIRFEDQVSYENFVGHDVHLARVQDSTGIAEIAAWMDWRAPGGLETPAPAEFLGGAQESPAGTTQYLRVNLEPGRYIWVAEVPDPQSKGMLVPFTVQERE